MVGGSDRQASPSRTPLVPKLRRRAWIPIPRPSRGGWRGHPGLGALAACGTSSASTGPVTLNFYFYPDGSGATQQAIDNCNAEPAASTRSPTSSCPGRGRPAAADGPPAGRARQHRWTSWAWTSPGKPSSLRPAGSSRGPARTKPQAEKARSARPGHGDLEGQALRGAGQQQHPAAVVPLRPGKTPPKTWAQMFADAAQLAKEGKPHYIEIQGAQYEGATVWFNTMVASAGGSILNPAATKAIAGCASGEGAVDHAPAGHRAGGGPVAGRADGEPEPAGDGGRHRGVRAELPVRVSGDEAGQPEAVQGLQVGALPGGHPRGPAKVTIGGIDLAVSRYSQHKALAFQAALCLRDREPDHRGQRRRRAAPITACTTTRRCSRTTRSTRTS